MTQDARFDQQPHEVTGDEQVDTLCLKLWQSLPSIKSDHDPQSVWRRCLGLASFTLRGYADPTPETVKEAAYRRGYVHGIVESVSAIDHRGADAESLDEWAMGPVMDWRYQRHQGTKTPPPQFGVKPVEGKL